MSETLYRGMTAEALTDAYSPSKTVPGGVGPWVERYRQDSDAVKAERAYSTHSYGNSAEHTLDFFPAANEKAPLHVFVHGGYWQQLSKDDSSAMAPFFLDQGSHFATLNYTLAPTAKIEDIVEEVKQALVWLWQNADALKVDTTQLSLSGHSAGGHLCAMMLCQDWTAVGLPQDPFTKVTLISGVFELEPLCATYINDALGMDIDNAKSLSPQLTAVASRSQVSLVVGELESDEFQRQSVDYAKQLNAAGLTARTDIIEGRHHFDIILNFDSFPK